MANTTQHHSVSSSVDASVIICAYTEDRWDDLTEAVDSVFQQEPAPLELILVIDHNPTLLARAQAAFPGCVVVPNVEERGLSGARNSGIAQAGGEIVVFLDDDAAATPGWLGRLVAGYIDDTVVGVGGAAFPVWAAGQPRWFPTEFAWVVGCSYTGMPTEVAPIRNLMGCNMSFRRSAFEEVGGFRSGIGRVGLRPVGCEETELCIRVRQQIKGAVFLFDPEATVHHRVPEGRSRWSYFRARCFAEGISKALVSDHVGADDALSSERAYVTRTLSAGVARRLIPRRQLTGRLAQAAAIVAGTVITAAGYMRGKVRSRTKGSVRSKLRRCAA
jgi:glycosyltransferase involved in cell wall biosynthesis